MGAAFYFNFAAFYAQGFVERDRLQVFDCHFAGQGDYMVELVYLAHGVVEDAGDDAAVAVAWGSGVALAEAEAADEGLAGFVEREFQAHAFGIVHAADEAVVFLHFDVAGVVAMGLGWHENDFNLRGDSHRRRKKRSRREAREGRDRKALGQRWRRQVARVLRFAQDDRGEEDTRSHEADSLILEQREG